LIVAVGVAEGRLVEVALGVSVNVLVKVRVFVGAGVGVKVGGKGEEVRVGGGVGVGGTNPGMATAPRSQAIKRSGRSRRKLRLII
jgi:hypothetical protein